MDLAEFSTRKAPTPIAGGVSKPVVAPVSDNGALGFLPANYGSPDRLRSDPDVLGQLGGAPFGLNVFAAADLVGSMLPEPQPASRRLDTPHHTVIEHRVVAAATARTAR